MQYKLDEELIGKIINLLNTMPIGNRTALSVLSELEKAIIAQQVQPETTKDGE